MEAKDKYIPRDLSWLLFNERVLNEATEPQNPLLEQAKFLAIFVSNLDEFYAVRVASLKNRIESQVNDTLYGYSATQLLEHILEYSQNLIKQLYQTYQKNILKQFETHKIYIRKCTDLRKEQAKFVEDYFQTTLYPIVTPLAVDPGHPFPVLPSKTLAFAVHVKRKGEENLAIVPIPKNIPRLLRVPSARDEYCFVLIEEVIRVYLEQFFKGYELVDFSLFRVVRDSELEDGDASTPDLLKTIDRQVKKRSFAKPVYLEVERKCSPDLLLMLCDGLKFVMDEVTEIDSDFDLTFLFELFGHIDNSKLKYPSFTPATVEYEDIFEHIKQQDFLIHMPFQSFDPTVDLVQSAARDPNVLAIKMTLYRTDKGSAIIDALKEAAVNGKQVTTLVEIKARFDEENNIRWTRQLEEAGCHVIYGIPGLKVHSKMTLVVREEEGRIQRYVHLSTGNYNQKTSEIYTDVGYFTVNEDIARDISELFNVITGYSQPTHWDQIIAAPDKMRDYTMALIEREIKFQKKYKNGHIFAKFNSLEDLKIIDKLYEASQAGVKIKLIVRGICCLIPGIEGLSENIEVKSVVGRFLEHTRIFIYNNNDNPRVFLSSADWMKRNFDRRIEILFEVNKADIKDHLRKIMNLYWKDVHNSWELNSVGEYMKLESKGKAYNIQQDLIERYA